MSTRRVQGLNHSWRWTKIIIWILGIDTTFDRVEFGIIVFSAQSVSSSHFDLLRNQVIINDLFGNRVFNLNSRVHFHKIEIAVFVHQKLNCTCPFIFDKFGGFYSGFPHFFPQFICHKGRRGFFGQFLVTTLNRTVSFWEVTGFSKRVANHLDLDMSWLFNKLFHIHPIVSKRGFGFLSCAIPRFLKIIFWPNCAHSFSSTTSCGFQHHGVSYFFGKFFTLCKVFNQSLRTGNCWHTRSFHCRLGCSLITHFADHIGWCADKLNLVFVTDFGKLGIFRQKPIARVNGVGVCDFSCCNDIWNFEVGFRTWCRAYTNGFVGKLNV